MPITTNLNPVANAWKKATKGLTTNVLEKETLDNAVVGTVSNTTRATVTGKVVRKNTKVVAPE